MIVPLGYSSPSAYLSTPSLSLSLTFTPSSPLPSPSTVSYAIVGSLSPSSPTILFLNGMAGHSLVAHIFNGPALAAERPVRLIAIDRPGARGSTPCEGKDRVKWTIEALLAIMEKEEVTSFTLLSHSNGIIYSLPFLLHLSTLPSTPYKCSRYLLTSPYVPPWLSSSLLLSVARFIPTPLTRSLGPVAKPLLTTFGWSSAAIGWSSGWSSTVTGTPKPGSPERPEVIYQKLMKKELRKSTRERLAGVAYYSPETMDLCMKKIIEGGLTSVGEEAVMCMKPNGVRWDWPGEDEEGFLEGELFERGFGRLKEVYGEEWEMRCWYGEDDALIPKKGRDYVRKLWGRLGLLNESEGWTVVERCGHDDLLGLEWIMKGIMESVV